MAKRKRRKPQPGEFEDPLSNYNPPSYEDELERSLCEGQMDVFNTTPIATVPPSASIQSAMKLMDELGVACLLIVAGDRIMGVFSERDVLNHLADNFDALKDHPVSEVMTIDPSCVHETDIPAQALNLMAVGGFRHVPILNMDEKLVGVLGPRRVTAYIRKHFNRPAGG